MLFLILSIFKRDFHALLHRDAAGDLRGDPEGLRFNKCPDWAQGAPPRGLQES